MVLLASDYDKSKYLRAEDLKQREESSASKPSPKRCSSDDGKAEKKLVRLVHQRRPGAGAEQDQQPDHSRRVRRRHCRLGRQDHRRVSDDDRLPRQDGPRLRVRIPPPKQATAAPQQPVTSGNGAAALRQLRRRLRQQRRCRGCAAQLLWIRSLNLIR